MKTPKNKSRLDSMDFNDAAEALRVGKRIRNIRIEKGLSQTELGELVGLTADRIQKYENGARKPRTDLLRKIAEALGVNMLALADPDTTSYVGGMYALFEMEKNFDLKVEKLGNEGNSSMCLTIDHTNPFYEYVEMWYDMKSKVKTDMEAAATEEEKKKIIESYHQLQWDFPQVVVERRNPELQKARLRERIEALQKLYEGMSEKKE